jgi:flagellar biosynthesis/type III secretory pathway protein FliH
MNTTTSESKRAKRRTFKEVATAAHAKGWSEGREAARVDFEKAYNLLAQHSNAMELEAAQLRERLANVSLRKLAWSRITGLFGAKP